MPHCPKGSGFWPMLIPIGIGQEKTKTLCDLLALSDSLSKVYLSAYSLIKKRSFYKASNLHILTG